MKRDKHNTDREALAFATGYVYGRIEDQFDPIAVGSGGSFTGPELAERVGQILLSTARGSVLGGPEHLPPMRRASTEGNERSTSKKVHVRAHGRKTRRSIGRPTKASQGIRAYWDNMTQEERSAEIRRRKAVSGRKAKTSARRTGPGVYWDKMTPEARKAEMQRRMSLWKRKAA
jgi:hypothetical protein